MESMDVKEMQSSFSEIYAKKAELAERFYVHLFDQMPEIEALFSDDFAKQKEMFASMLTYCLRGAVDNRSLIHAGDTLAKTHAQYNLGPREAEMAGKAVMAALVDVLGDDLSAAQAIVWQQAIARVMRMFLQGEEAEQRAST
ncbi:globin domain-containing protein [Pseudophaeobacter sp.]|uniref:globin domain-containing protein n=1 Tax=Pseudophaeobacter sp. TaxID=1971739 RepID=UPI0032987DF1